MANFDKAWTNWKIHLFSAGAEHISALIRGSSRKWCREETRPLLNRKAQDSRE
jgi:hypothetical protein